MRYMALYSAALLIIVLSIAQVAAQWLAHDEPSRLAVPHGATLERVSKLWPVVCYWSYWTAGNYFYCIADLERHVDRVIRARIKFRAQRVADVRYYTYLYRDGVTAYTSCGGY